MTRQEERLLREAWPDIREEVRYAPLGNKVGVLTGYEVGSKGQRNQAGMILGGWRKLLHEAPQWGRVIDYELSECEYVLMLGGRGWRDDVLGPEMWGKWFVYNSRHMVMPVQDPETLARGSAGKWGEQVGMFFEGAVAGVGTWALDVRCIRGTCGNPLWRYDRDGVSWCERHWTERYPESNVQKKLAARRAGSMEAGELF